ncbi:hypothetical protein PUN28_018389 [Cardiocondyla obscurior]|uniref:Uncharacterized protein n=1 Tax=Cardiocondyla obscurior TaxID=286306 RepID=A0AAW2EIN7_9HYME
MSIQINIYPSYDNDICVYTYIYTICIFKYSLKTMLSKRVLRVYKINPYKYVRAKVTIQFSFVCSFANGVRGREEKMTGGVRVEKTKKREKVLFRRIVLSVSSGFANRSSRLKLRKVTDHVSFLSLSLSLSRLIAKKSTRPLIKRDKRRKTVFAKKVGEKTAQNKSTVKRNAMYVQVYTNVRYSYF